MLQHKAKGLQSFSAFGRLLELNNRTSESPGLPSERPPSGSASSNKLPHRQARKDSNTTAFTSVSRERKGNFRFPVRLCRHEFKYHPDSFYGKQRLPSWSFAKAERTPRQRYVDYEVCAKSPLLARTKGARGSLNSTWANEDTPEQEPPNDKAKALASTGADSGAFAGATAASRGGFGMAPNKTCTDRFNYSIVAQKDLSPVGQHSKSKIVSSAKLGRQEVLVAEEEERLDHEPTGMLAEGYVDMGKQRGRRPNVLAG